MNKYSYNEFYNTKENIEKQYNQSFTTSIENALTYTHNAYLAMMKRKTTTNADIEALNMIIEMAEIAKKHLEENRG